MNKEQIYKKTQQHRNDVHNYIIVYNYIEIA